MIETASLILTQTVMEDVDLYLRMFKCPDTTRYLPNEGPYSNEQIHQYVTKRVEHWRAGFGTFTIAEKATREKIGYVGVEKSPDPLFSDIRYGIDLSRRGRNYAVEAAIECLRFTFTLGLHEKVYGAAVAENRASVRVLHKIGMVEEPGTGFYGCPDLIYLSVTKGSFLKKMDVQAD